MSFSSLTRLLPGLLAPLLACSVAHAQIHEEKPGPGLEEGILAHYEKDAKHNVPAAAGQRIGTGDFSVVCSFVWKGGPPMFDGFGPLSGASNEGGGWKLMLGSSGILGFSAYGAGKNPGHSIDSPALDLRLDQENLVVISAHRDARQPGCGLWVNGVEVASGILPPVDLGDGIPKALSTALETTSLTLYNRALTRPEILELTLRGTGNGNGTASDQPKPKPKHPAPPPNGPRFIPQPDETIALIGGTEAVALAESGELEALLLMAFPQTKFHFRCLAWEGDTVFRQDRPMNFGSLEQQLRRVNAGAVFVMFGRQECLDAAQTTRSGDWQSPTETPPRSGKPEASEQGAARSGNDGDSQSPLLVEFKTAFEKLLATVEKVTPNIVVIGPPLFEKKPPPLPDLSVKNDDVRAYNGALRHLAAERGYEFADGTVGMNGMVDLNINGFDQDPKYLVHCDVTTDGVDLSDHGRSSLAHEIRFALSIPDVRLWQGRPEVLQRFRDNERAIRAALALKNRLWHDYWRPSNWAFLHGDRTNQPSSRDPVNPQIRLFPAEQEKYLPLIKEAEDNIFQLVHEAQKKVP
jgi:hypothetical protein